MIRSERLAAFFFVALLVLNVPVKAGGSAEEPSILGLSEL
jgi:hypothetical protein